MFVCLSEENALKIINNEVNYSKLTKEIAITLRIYKSK